MSKLITLVIVNIVIVLGEFLVGGCLITNCPRGGKRSKSLAETSVKPCVSCGPGQTGQCFGPSICCGPFGCLMGTSETLRCQREGLFHEREPCTAGNGMCRRNSGRCAFEGICCNQDSCYTDKTCTNDEKLRNFPENPLDFYSLFNYQAELIGDK